MDRVLGGARLCVTHGGAWVAPDQRIPLRRQGRPMHGIIASAEFAPLRVGSTYAKTRMALSGTQLL